MKTGAPHNCDTPGFKTQQTEKLSRGDIAGYLIQKGGLAPDEVGKITVKDHHALAAVPSVKITDLLARLKGQKIKNKSVRISRC